MFCNNEKKRARIVENRGSLITTVKTPLGFFTLGLLVVEGILGGLAVKADGTDFTTLIWIIGGSLVLILTAVWVLALVQPELFMVSQKEVSLPGAASDIPENEIHFDAFVSAPMASVDDEAYREMRETVSAIVGDLKKHANMASVYYAGEEIETQADFDADVLAIKADFEKIRASRSFILLYPARIASSALIEVGFALALGKPVVIAVTNRDDLPFLLRSAGQALKRVRIYDCDNLDSFLKLIRKHGSALVPS